MRKRCRYEKLLKSYKENIGAQPTTPPARPRPIASGAGTRYPYTPMAVERIPPRSGHNTSITSCTWTGAAYHIAIDKLT
jgi:hypothetical protein